MAVRCLRVRVGRSPEPGPGRTSSREQARSRSPRVTSPLGSQHCRESFPHFRWHGELRFLDLIDRGVGELPEGWDEVLADGVPS